MDIDFPIILSTDSGNETVTLEIDQNNVAF